MKLVLTGFGPFGQHTTNASWQGVQAVPELWKKSKHDGVVELVIDEVPVSYDYVKQKVPDKWMPFDFVIHVGVSSLNESIGLETCAHSSGYTRADINAKCPPGGLCDKEEDKVMNTCLDIQTICQDLNCTLAEDGIEFTSSSDAGRYLCEFIYYSSLSKTAGRTLFVHVPPLSNLYTQEQLGKALFCILDKIVDYVSSEQTLHKL
jgi:pyroglutamyl-peptidase